MKALFESLEFLLETFQQWFECVLSPLRVARELLDPDLQTKERIRATRRLWITASVLAIVIQSPVYKAVGIGLTAYEFLLPNFLILLLTVIVSGVLVQRSLRLYGINAPFYDVVAIHTALNAAYMPVWAFLQLPINLSAMTKLRDAKAHDLSLSATIHNLGAVNTMSDIANITGAITTPVLIGISGVLLGLYAHVIAERYNADKYRAISAVTLAYVVTLIPAAIFSALSYGAMYLAMK